MKVKVLVILEPCLKYTILFFFFFFKLTSFDRTNMDAGKIRGGAHIIYKKKFTWNCVNI